MECVKACTRNGISTDQKYSGNIKSARMYNAEIHCLFMDTDYEFGIPLVNILNNRIPTDSDIIADTEPGESEMNKVILSFMHVALIIVTESKNWQQELNTMLSMSEEAGCTPIVLANCFTVQDSFFLNVSDVCKKKQTTYLGNLPFLHNGENYEIHQTAIKLPDESINYIWKKIIETRNTKSLN